MTDQGMTERVGTRFDALFGGAEVDHDLRSFLNGVPGVTLPGAPGEDAAPVASLRARTPRSAETFGADAEPFAAHTYVVDAEPVAVEPLAASAPVAPPRERAPFMPAVVRPRLAAAVEEALMGIDPEVDPEFVAAVAAVVDLGASDLHLVTGSTPVVRIDGELRSVPDTSVWDRDRVVRVVEGFVPADLMAQFRRDLELDFAYTVGDVARFRVNVFQDKRGIGAALRIIPTAIKSVTQLGLPRNLVNLANLARGLVLVCGPTGSGKSTTLAAIIDRANSTRPAHIVTVEDPVEFLHDHKRGIINQREVGADTHSFSEALKHALRQDPDIILVGEMRDLETISTALTVAETGHLVFATLHTQDAAQTIDRIIDVYPPHQQAQVRTQLATTLQAVVVQTLLPRAGGRGRTVATEVMFVNPAIQALIRAGKNHQLRTALQAGDDNGMHTLDQDLARLVQEGEVEYGVALDLAQDRAEFAQLVGNRGLSRAASGDLHPEGTRQVAGLPGGGS